MLQNSCIFQKDGQRTTVLLRDYFGDIITHNRYTKNQCSSNRDELSRRTAVVVIYERLNEAKPQNNQLHLTKGKLSTEMQTICDTVWRGAGYNVTQQGRTHIKTVTTYNTKNGSCLCMATSSDTSD